MPRMASFLLVISSIVVLLLLPSPTSAHVQVPVSTRVVGTGLSTTFTLYSMMDNQGRLVYGDYMELKRISTGGVTTVVADLSSFSQNLWILGIAEDDAGNYYVATYAAGVIIKIDTNNGNTATVYAGTADTFGSTDGPRQSALFSNAVNDVKYNAYTKSVFVLDVGDTPGLYSIRKIDASTGTVSTVVADSNLYAYSFTVTSDASTIYTPSSYINSVGFSVVLKIDVATASISVVAGSTTTNGNVDGVGTAARFTSIDWTALNADETKLIIGDDVDGLRIMDIATSYVGMLLPASADIPWMYGLQQYCNFSVCGVIATELAHGVAWFVSFEDSTHTQSPSISASLTSITHPPAATASESPTPTQLITPSASPSLSPSSSVSPSRTLTSTPTIGLSPSSALTPSSSSSRTIQTRSQSSSKSRTPSMTLSETEYDALVSYQPTSWTFVIVLVCVLGVAGIVTIAVVTWMCVRGNKHNADMKESHEPQAMQDRPAESSQQSAADGPHQV